jgi:hypothetical protein
MSRGISLAKYEQARRAYSANEELNWPLALVTGMVLLVLLLLHNCTRSSDSTKSIPALRTWTHSIVSRNWRNTCGKTVAAWGQLGLTNTTLGRQWASKASTLVPTPTSDAPRGKELGGAETARTVPSPGVAAPCNATFAGSSGWDKEMIRASLRMLSGDISIKKEYLPAALASASRFQNLYVRDSGSAYKVTNN